MEKNYVGKLWKTITWEMCGNFVKRIVWKKCGQEYFEKSVKYNNMGKLWKFCEKNSVEQMWKEYCE